MLGLWFLVQLSALSVTRNELPASAFGTYVGGFLANIFLVVILRPRRTRLLRPGRGHSFDGPSAGGVGPVRPGRRLGRALGIAVFAGSGRWATRGLLVSVACRDGGRILYHSVVVFATSRHRPRRLG